LIGKRPGGCELSKRAENQVWIRWSYGNRNQNDVSISTDTWSKAASAATAQQGEAQQGSARGMRLYEGFPSI